MSMCRRAVTATRLFPILAYPDACRVAKTCMSIVRSNSSINLATMRQSGVANIFSCIARLELHGYAQSSSMLRVHSFCCVGERLYYRFVFVFSSSSASGKNTLDVTTLAFQWTPKNVWYVIVLSKNTC